MIPCIPNAPAAVMISRHVAMGEDKSFTCNGLHYSFKITGEMTGDTSSTYYRVKVSRIIDRKKVVVGLYDAAILDSGDRVYIHIEEEVSDERR